MSGYCTRDLQPKDLLYCKVLEAGIHFLRTGWIWRTRPTLLHQSYLVHIEGIYCGEPEKFVWLFARPEPRLLLLLFHLD